MNQRRPALNLSNSLEITNRSCAGCIADWSTPCVDGNAIMGEGRHFEGAHAPVGRRWRRPAYIAPAKCFMLTHLRSATCPGTCEVQYASAPAKCNAIRRSAWRTCACSKISARTCECNGKSSAVAPASAASLYGDLGDLDDRFELIAYLCTEPRR